MSTNRKTRSDAVLGNLTEDRQATIADYCRSHSEDEAVAWLKADGVRTSRTALSRWLSSYGLRQQFKLADHDSLNFITLLRQKRPDLPETELQSWASEFFQMQAVKSGNAEMFLAFATARHKAEMDKAKLDQRERALQFDKEKFAASLATKIEAGLDALFQEVKANPEARALFEKFKAVVTKATA